MNQKTEENPYNLWPVYLQWYKQNYTKKFHQFKKTKTEKEITNKSNPHYSLDWKLLQHQECTIHSNAIISNNPVKPTDQLDEINKIKSQLPKKENVNKYQDQDAKPSKVIPKRQITKKQNHPYMQLDITPT